MTQCAEEGMEREALYYLHIPKTAGTSFMNLLHQNYGNEQVCPAYLWRDMLRIPVSQRQTYAVFRGHFYAYLGDWLQRPLRVITFLRDPVERSLSLYAHICREPGHYFHEYVKQQDGLRAFLADPVTHPLITDFQTRSLAQRLNPERIAAALSKEQLEALVLERTLETMMPTGADDELLVRAKACLDRCLFVGITEQFDVSVNRLAELLQWEAQPEEVSLNVSPARLHRDALDAETLEVLLRHTALDQVLYQYACARFSGSDQ